MEPTNRHEPPFPACNMQTHDVDEFHAVTHLGAAISEDAIVGAAAEWRGMTTRYPVLVDSGAIIREFVTVHGGVQRETRIGSGTLLMTKSHVGHDVWIGEDCDVAPNASIGGCCTIGNRVKIGMNAAIRPHVTIGDGARIGAGAVVVKDVPAGETWAGVPARRIR